MRKKMISFGVIALTVGVFVAGELLTPKPVDWSMSFSRRDRIPYGTYILAAILPDIFPGARISISHDSIYDTLNGRSLRDVNYIIIDNTVSFDEHDTKELLRFVKEGNNVFIAASYFLGSFAERLLLSTAPDKGAAEKMRVHLTNPALRGAKPYIFSRGTANVKFTRFRREGAAVLGKNHWGGVNFIRLRYGRGFFYLSCIPFAYTNVNLLDYANAQYACKTLSYLPVRDTIWDEYYKAARPRPATPLRFILSREPLAWAYYTGIACLLLFMAFGARRRQRPIPIVRPPENATIAFVRTVGSLYLHVKDNKNMAEKMILYFHERLTQLLKADMFMPDGDREAIIAERAGLPRLRVGELFRAMGQVRASKRVSDKELMDLNARIAKITAALKGKRYEKRT